jgi:hypothetical protein
VPVSTPGSLVILVVDDSGGRPQASQMRHSVNNFNWYGLITHPFGYTRFKILCTVKSVLMIRIRIFQRKKKLQCRLARAGTSHLVTVDQQTTNLPVVVNLFFSCAVYFLKWLVIGNREE